MGISIWRTAMEPGASAQAEFDNMNTEYRAYISKLRAEWLARYEVRSFEVYEVMRPEEQAEVHQRVAQWARYITPLAEAWWKERGYGVIWPTDDSKPMQVYMLDAA
jgi:hypothetical protein